MSENMENTPVPEPNKSAQFDPDDHLEQTAGAGGVNALVPIPDRQRSRTHSSHVYFRRLQLTSKPVAVKDIWGQFGRKKESFAYSLRASR